MRLYLGNVTLKGRIWMLTLRHKKWQATYIAPLQPYTLAAFPPWGILQELVV